MEIETTTDYQKVKVANKIKKMFGHINPRTSMELCPIRDIMALSSDKWSILIFLYLGFFPVLRFNELKKKVYGISNKVLSERLKTLDRDGYISRKMYSEVPIRVEYQLTDFGHSYLKKLLELTEWVDTYKETIQENRLKYKAS
ncbi:MAG: HxlR family transcriptional regulator [Flavobacteriaceae bacterium]|nr:MAG: HxlR family transcriptional regulator [Flavobacteriaceae bacterium]